MKLTVELVPKTAWNQSLAKLLPRKVWTGIRENHIANNGKKCEICGETEGIFNLHEIWNYNDVNYVQTLDGFTLLCTMCHHVKHIGLTKILASEGKLDLNAVISHFCEVNGCTAKDFQEYEKEAFSVWRNRSMHPWKQDFGEYGQYLKKAKA
jgi:hypothetical protein